MIVFIYKNNIDGKAHEKHVNGVTSCNNKGLAGRKGFSVKKAGHPGQKSISKSPILRNDRIFGYVEDGKQSLVPFFKL